VTPGGVDREGEAEFASAADGEGGVEERGGVHARGVAPTHAHVDAADAQTHAAAGRCDGVVEREEDVDGGVGTEEDAGEFVDAVRGNERGRPLRAVLAAEAREHDGEATSERGPSRERA
jgi:hypothetical protein